jgi:Mg-chelatase subunit ChlD
MGGNMRTLRSSLVVLLILIVSCLTCFADKRTENIDIILAIDKSLSMGENQKIDAVERYANTWLLDEVLIPGDFLVVIAFYGKAEAIISETVTNETIKQSIKDKISQIRGNGRFTDIGNALDAMKVQMDKYKDNGRKKFVLMMTDGIQEAPPYSKYFTQRGKYNYEFVENTKTILQQGWKIEILGIGADAEVKDLATQLQGSYAQITDQLSVDTIKAQTENLLGTITLMEGTRVAPVGIGGSSSISCSLKSEGYSKPIDVVVTGVEVRLPSRTVSNTLASPYTIRVGATGSTKARIPIQFPSDLETGKYSGIIVFSFASGERFNPSEIQTQIDVNGLVANYWWLAIIALVALAVLIILIIFLVRFLSNRPQRFHLFVDGESLTAQPITIKSGRELILNESEESFLLVHKRNARSIARFRMKAGSLGFDIWKPERFPKTEDPVEDIVGKSYVVKSQHGESRKLTIVPVETARAKPKAAPPKAEDKPQPSVKLTMVKRTAASSTVAKTAAKTRVRAPKKAASKSASAGRRKRGRK